MFLVYIDSNAVTHMWSTPEKCQVGGFVDVLALNRYYGWYVHGGELDVAKAKLREKLLHK